MGNLFSRSDRSEKTQPPQRSTTLPSNTVQPDRSQFQQGMQRDQDTRYHPQYRSGNTLPAGGRYDNPQQKDSPSYNQQATQAYGSYPQQSYESRPSDLRIDTSGGRGRNVGQPATSPIESYQRTNSHQEGQRGSYSAANTHSSNMNIPTTRGPVSTHTGRSSIDPHVVSLHKRSRSPTTAQAGGRVVDSPEPASAVPAAYRHSAGPPGHGDLLAPPDRSGRNSGGTPVEGLGTFTSKRISPVDGIPRSDEEQEAPFRIGIPGSEEEVARQRRRTRQVLIEQGRFVEAAAIGGGVVDGERERVVSPTTDRVKDGDRRRESETSGEGGDEVRPATVAERMMNPKVDRDRGMSATSVARAPLSRAATDDRVEGAAAAPGSDVGIRAGGAAGASKPMPAQPRGFVAELPGSKAEGYESEEDVQMSATVKPGDWEMPVFV